MKRGAKSKTPSELKASGTFRPVRHQGLVELGAPRDVPVQPGWLTEDGQEAWSHLIEHVVATGSATAADSTLLGTLCNLIGASAACWRSGSVPPAAHLSELRRLSETFRVAGAVSRVGMPAPSRPDNIFARIAQGRGPDGR